MTTERPLDANMKNIIVSAGHGLRDPGAVSGFHVEHLHAYQITWLLRHELEAKNCACEFISCFQPLASKIRKVNELHAVKPVDLAIEIHFNSASDEAAHGTEVLHYSQKLQPLADKISAYLANAISTLNRGPKKRDDLGWLKQTQCPAIIVEVCFLSNDSDTAILQGPGFHLSAAKAIAEGVSNG